MPKTAIIVSGALATVAVIGGIVFFTTQDNTKKDDPSQSTNQTDNKTTKLDDPNGDYKLFSDPSVTKKPANDVKFGNGQTLTFEYDGSKTENDPYATLSYQLYYIQDDGKVQPMGGGNMEGTGGKGTFTVSNSVFNSSAKDRDGFLELIATYKSSVDANNKISASNVNLGMYSVKFDVAD